MGSDTKVGLEIHIYPRMENATKLFCACRIDPDAAPNTNICPTCTGQPGANPMLPNREAIVKTIAIARVFGSTLDENPGFQRKHYSWPDLPSGYQRTMSGSYAYPIARGGEFEKIRIQQVHLEEDPARWDPETGTVDYNRSGTPLVEVVTEPDFKDPEQVREWLDAFRLRLDYAGCFDERFGIKADVNVSIAPDYRRVEIKNINSFSAIYESIISEAERQQEEQTAGREVALETRTWTGSCTVAMRSKEEAADYRFIPEQDLPVVRIAEDMSNEAAALVQRDPESARAALLKAGVSSEDAGVLVEQPIVVEYARGLLGKIPGSFVGRFMRTEFLRVVNYAHAHPRDFAGTPEHVADVAQLLSDQKISDKTTRDLMERLMREDFDVSSYVEEHNLMMISDESFLEKAAAEVISEQQQAVEDYKSGKAEAINFLAGQLMRKTKGKADIRKARAMLEELIGRD